MIHCNEALRTFQLDSKNSSYVIGVYHGDYLLHLYYGKKIPQDENLFDTINRGRHSSTLAQDPKLIEEGIRDFYIGNAPFEYPTNGNADFRTSAVAIRNADGNAVTDLRYVGHRITEGKPRLEGMPSLRAGCGDAQTLEIDTRDAYTGALVTLYYTVYENLDAIVRSVKIQNQGNKPFRVETAASLSLELPGMEYDFVSFWGEHLEERMLSRAPLRHGMQSVGSKSGSASHFSNPCAILAEHKTDETSGECYGVNLVYSGSFSISAEVDAMCMTRLMAGINDHDFSWEVRPGDAFQTPECVLVFSDRGFGEMSRTFHRLYLDHLIPERWAYTKRPFLINSWEAAYFDFDTDKLISFAESAHELGMEMLVMDDGWFGHRNKDDSSLGDWYVNEKKLDLGRLTKSVHDMGMKFGIWFEPEMVSPDSDLYRAHPDWIIHVPGRTPSIGRTQYVLDFSRKEVRDNIFAQMSAILDTYEIDYVKWDYNRNITEAGSAALDAEHAGEFYHRYILGLYDILDRFTRKYPHILLEGCAGGGGRFEPAWLSYAPQIWCSDNTNPIDRVRIQYGTSMFYPYSTMGAHVSKKDGVSDYHMRGCVAMAGTFGYEMDPRTFTEEEKLLVKEQIANYHKYYDLIHFGDLYRLLSPYEADESRSVWSFVSRDKNRCLVTAVTYRRVFHHYFLFKLQGLDPDRMYRCEKLGITASGSRWMNAGVNLCGEMRAEGSAVELYFEAVEA